ncbi:MAG: AbfB domain-containing protein [Streptosporangiaceae bacterium]|nr:AbfB domain-containing protein [Streptosporangiaceae bacterium]MBV9854189.1 AbfB domain-containing protein [Streptosporangiaceae bacterium]
MENSGASSPEERDERLDGLVRPYVSGSGDNTNRPLDDPVGNGLPGGSVSLPEADEASVSGWFGPASPPELESASPAEQGAARPPVRRSHVAIVAAAGIATFTIGLLLVLPNHSTTVLASKCQPGNCAQIAPQVPGTVLPVPAPSGASAPHPARPPASRPATAEATGRKVAATATATAAPSATATGPAPSPTPAVPALTPGSRISIRATTACCTSFYIRHDDGDNRVVITQITPGSSAATRADATWIVQAGLASSSCVSFESANDPGQYLRHSDFELYLDPDDGSSLFAHDATFCPRRGNSGQGYSFQSVNYPYKYIRHYDYVVYIGSDGGWNPWDTPALWPNDTTWLVTWPWG